jgi:ABC-type antimicrobial peptide transport system permease subunit
MNLTTARSRQRAREVGIRKVVGSLRYQLIGQFLGEAFLLTTLAIIFALGITQLSLPFFNALSGKHLGIPWTDPLFAAALIVLLFITTLLAGGYPAFFLSGFRPVKVLKGDLSIGSSLPRKVLVVLQFTVSISLVIGAILIGRQIDFARDRPIGYSRAGLLNIGKNTSDLYQAQYNSLRDDLLRTGMVGDMAESSVAATEPLEADRGVFWLGEDSTTKPSFTSVFITADYGNTIHWQLVSGRDFRRDFATDSDKVIINQSAARLMGFAQPIGKEIMAYGGRLTIIGVVRDMVATSPFQKVQPGLFTLAPATNLNDILIRVTPSNPMRQALAAIEKIFHRYNPASPFDFHFVDTDYALKFADEECIDGLTRVFTALAIFISCLGLFGLAAFTAGRRARELSIRKVLGSSIFNCWKLLTAETVRLVLLSSAIALPLAGLFMNKWLQQYEYRTPLHWWVFAAAAGGVLVLALLTVSFHALKAAHTNPAKTLRSQ